MHSRERPGKGGMSFCATEMSSAKVAEFRENAKISTGIGFGKVVNEDVRKKNNTNHQNKPSLFE